MAQREIAEVQQAVKAAGATSPAALILNLVRQQGRADAMILCVERQLQAVVEVSLGAAVAQLGDRLAADMAAISTAIAAVSDAIEDRPTKSQLSSYLEHATRRVAGGGSPSQAAAGTSTPGAKVAP